MAFAQPSFFLRILPKRQPVNWDSAPNGPAGKNAPGPKPGGAALWGRAARIHPHVCPYLVTVRTQPGRAWSHLGELPSAGTCSHSPCICPLRRTQNSQSPGSGAGKLARGRVQKWAGVCLKKKRVETPPAKSAEKITEVCLSGPEPLPAARAEEPTQGRFLRLRRVSAGPATPHPPPAPGPARRDGTVPAIADEQPQRHFARPPRPRPRDGVDHNGHSHHGRSDHRRGLLPGRPAPAHTALHVPAQGHVPHA